jgi:hypothetical protein
MIWKREFNDSRGTAYFQDLEIDDCLNKYERPTKLVSTDGYAQFLKLSEKFVVCFVWDDLPGSRDTPRGWAIYERVEE